MLKMLGPPFCYNYQNCFICFGALFTAHPVYQGVKIWNSIPVEIQKLPKLTSKFKAHLMQTCLKK